MKILNSINVALVISIFFVSTLHSSIQNNIIAKVGNEIITSFELENKIKTNLLITRTQINQENINKIKKFALKSLINLKLKNSEIKKYNYQDNQVAIEDHLRKISLQLNVKKSELKEIFTNNKIDYEQYLNEIKTEFLWQKLIYQIYVKKISVNDDEITSELNLIIANNKKKKFEEYHLAEIELELDNIADKERMIEEVQNNIKEIGFKETAINFSSSITSINGGDLGWIKSSSLSERILTLLKEKKPGDIIRPYIETNKLIFLKIVDKRTTKSNQTLNIEGIKNNLIDRKKKELLDLYSNNHLSKIRNSTLIEIQ